MQDGAPPLRLSTHQRRRAEAVFALQLAAVARLGRMIRGADPKGRSKRPDETAWCCAAVAQGALGGRRVTHKDLVAMAEGRLSPATLSRAVQDAVTLGLLRQQQEDGNRRVKRLLLTEAGWDAVLEGTEADYAAADALLGHATPACAA